MLRSATHLTATSHWRILNKIATPYGRAPTIGLRMLRTPEVDTLSTCKLCDVNVTLGKQRRQFAIATGRYGKTPEEAMLLMPLCETCLTIVMREDRRNRWRNALQGNR